MLLCSSYLPLGSPSAQATRLFLAPLPGRKRISARGVSHLQSLYFVFVLLSLFYFVLFASLYQKHKKIVPTIVVIFLSYFNLVKMSIPEVEVRSFRQQGGESLKDDWYRINDAHHRCTKKIFHLDTS